jgi:hypothetical protein
VIARLDRSASRLNPIQLRRLQPFERSDTYQCRHRFLTAMQKGDVSARCDRINGRQHGGTPGVARSVKRFRSPRVVPA